MGGLRGYDLFFGSIWWNRLSHVKGDQKERREGDNHECHLKHTVEVPRRVIIWLQVSGPHRLGHKKMLMLVRTRV